MLIFGIIAATDLPANHANPQINPGIAGALAFQAAVPAGLDFAGSDPGVCRYRMLPPSFLLLAFRTYFLLFTYYTPRQTSKVLKTSRGLSKIIILFIRFIKHTSTNPDFIRHGASGKSDHFALHLYL